MATEEVCWQHCFTAIWLVPRETAVTVSVHMLCTPYNHATVSSLIKATKLRVHVCLAVTSHLHFCFSRMSGGFFMCYCSIVPKLQNQVEKVSQHLQLTFLLLTVVRWTAAPIM